MIHEPRIEIQQLGEAKGLGLFDPACIRLIFEMSELTQPTSDEGQSTWSA